MAVVVAVLAGCGDSRDFGELRKMSARENYKNGKDVYLGVVWNSKLGAFFEGAELAAAEINSEGGVGGRAIVLEYTDEAAFMRTDHASRAHSEGRYRNAMQVAGTHIAQAVASNKNITAVIGHTGISDATLAAMLTYSDEGILFLNGGATDSRIMWSSSANLYFQLLPQDIVMARRLADDMKQRHWDNVFFVYAASRHNEQIIELLKNEFVERKIRFAGATAIMEDANTSSAVEGSRRLQKGLAQLREGNVDAIVLLAPPALSAQLIRQTRATSVVQPFVGTGALDSPAFIDAVGDLGEGVVIASIYRDQSFEVKRFEQRFKRRFPNVRPDQAALMGYDSVRLYADAVAAAESTEPHMVAHALHYKIPLWYGLQGTYVFDDYGVKNIKYYIRELRRKDKSLAFVTAK